MWKAALHVNGFRPSMTVVYQDKISNYFFLSVYIWFEWHINKLHIGLMPTPGPSLTTGGTSKRKWWLQNQVDCWKI